MMARKARQFGINHNCAGHEIEKKQSRFRLFLHGSRSFPAPGFWQL